MPLPQMPPNLPVQMVRPHLHDLPTSPLPPGFTLRAFRSGEEPSWTEIVRAAETFFQVKE